MSRQREIQRKETEASLKIHEYGSEVRRYEPDYETGLHASEVAEREEEGLTNRQENDLTPSVSHIIRKNTLTLFNLINVVLAVAIIAVGKIENTLFMRVVLCNAVMGIWQELRSKKTLDNLSVLAQAKVDVIRDGRLHSVMQEDLVLDDVIQVEAGDQLCADGIVLHSKGIEADESLLTGETDRIKKNTGDTVWSGSFVAAGSAYIQVMAVGRHNYANSLASQAKQGKKGNSKLLLILNKIIQFVTIIIIPLGALLMTSDIRSGLSIQSSILGTSAAIIGMIPSGLILLTSVTMTVGAMKLAKQKALVQSLYSIETLARVDVLCLDKTGTITDGSLSFEKIITGQTHSEDEVRQALAELMGALEDTNSTAKTMSAEFGMTRTWTSTIQIPFHSDRKWSGAFFVSQGSYILGAPNVIFRGREEPLLQTANEYAEQGYRVLAVAHAEERISEDGLPDSLQCAGLVLLTDTIRSDAVQTFSYFVEEGVTLKVISGDNPRTVSNVAGKAGIPDTDKYKDMQEVSDTDDYVELIRDYTVFGHVRPDQKQRLIQALQEDGHTTCMTGDGVNDILAMRQSDCSVAMVSGSPAARNACDFVLMSSDFGAMVHVLREGRRVINNIERVASLYIVNTFYSALLTLIYSFLPLAYPYAPLQMTPVNALAVGIPGFVLALQNNYSRPRGRFAVNLFEHAVPAAITIVFNTMYIQLASWQFGIPYEEYSTMIVFLIGAVGVYLLDRIMRPITKVNKILLGGIVVGMAVVFLLLGEYFTYTGLLGKNMFFYIPLLYFSYHIHDFLGKANHQFVKWLYGKKQQRRQRK